MIQKADNKPDLIEYLFLLVIAYNIAPIVSRAISVSLTTYFYLGVLLVAIFFVIARNKGERLEKYLAFLIPFIIWKVYIFFATSQQLTTWAYSVFLDFAPPLIGIYIVCERKKKVDVFAWTIIALLLITAITSIIFLADDTDAARYLATVADSNEEKAVEYNWKNIGGYEFTYILTPCYPILIFAAKKKKIHPVLAAVFSVLILVYIFYAEYTIALLFFLLSSVLWFMKKDLKKKDLYIILIVAIIIVVFFYGVLTVFFEWLADTVDSETMSERLRALAGGEEGLEISEDNRLELYRTSLNTFLGSPLFGTVFEGGSIGFHSFILDFLATYGLIGGAILFGIYYNIYKNLYYRYKKRSGYGYVIWVFVQVILLSVINAGMQLFFLGLVAPALLKFVFDGDKDEDTLGC